MKNKLILSSVIINILLFFILFFNIWFSAEIMNLITPFLVAPLWIFLIILCFYVLGYMIVACIKEVKKAKLLILLPLVTYFLLGILVLYFPYFESKLHLEHFIYENKRMDIIEKYKNDEYFDVPNYISLDGDIITKEFENGEFIVGFWQFKGMLSSYSVLYYTSDDSVEDVRRGASGDYEMTYAYKVAPHWYYGTYE